MLETSSILKQAEISKVSSYASYSSVYVTGRWLAAL